MNISIETILQVIGAVSASSFVLVAMLDFLSAAVTIVTSKTASQKDDLFAQKVTFWAQCSKEILSEMRKLADRLSMFSRPETPKK